MEATQIEIAFAKVKFHAIIAWRGLCRTIYGATVAGLLAMAVYRFVSVAGETGWIAVCDFIAACTTMVVALANMYFMGCRKNGNARGKDRRQK